MAALEAVRARGGTVFVVAHRAGVINVADKLIVLQDGRIVECGPRQAVLAKLQAERKPGKLSSLCQRGRSHEHGAAADRLRSADERQSLA